MLHLMGGRYKPCDNDTVSVMIFAQCTTKKSIMKRHKHSESVYFSSDPTSVGSNATERRRPFSVLCLRRDIITPINIVQVHSFICSLMPFSQSFKLIIHDRFRYIHNSFSKEMEYLWTRVQALSVICSIMLDWSVRFQVLLFQSAVLFPPQEHEWLPKTNHKSNHVASFSLIN